MCLSVVTKLKQFHSKLRRFLFYKTRSWYIPGVIRIQGITGFNYCRCSPREINFIFDPRAKNGYMYMLHTRNRRRWALWVTHVVICRFHPCRGYWRGVSSIYCYLSRPLWITDRLDVSLLGPVCRWGPWHMVVSLYCLVADLYRPTENYKLSIIICLFLPKLIFIYFL